MQSPPLPIRVLFDQALEYEQNGDAYNAVKLYKRVAKQAGNWPSPYFHLGAIYKYRREWKPALHYSKKTVALDSANKTAWWTLGIAATALKKRRLACNVWSKFGLIDQKENDKEPICIRMKYDRQFEILLTHPIDPARGELSQIPHPASGRRYKDTILFDGEIAGYCVVRNKKIPIYEELGLFKRSRYHTFSCILESPEKAGLKLLSSLCREANLGFEVWSNASRAYANSSLLSKPEYYGRNLFNFETQDDKVIALAGQNQREVLKVLQSWKVISLKAFSGFERHL